MRTVGDIGYASSQMLAFSLLSAALAQPPTDRAATLVGGVAGLYGTPDTGAGTTTGRLLVHFPRLSFDGAAGEGWGGGPSRHLGWIFLGARVYSQKTYLRVGFHHHHETPQDAFVAEPFPVLFGIGEDINHRSGVQAGVGYEYQWGELIQVPFFERWHTGVDLAVSWLPLSEGPPLYIGLEINQGLHVGKKRLVAQ